MKQYYLFLTFLLLVFSLHSCAKRGSISGGPKDTLAPRIMQSSPKNFSTGFSGKSVRIEFNEFVKLKDANKQLVISPPMEQPPIISPSGASRHIEIMFRDTLRANTTYSLNFGQSIQDHNEGNILTQFKYVFSTGTYLDSLSVSGIVKDALAPQPDEFISVLLYEIDETFNDSLIYNRPPNYITNTLDSQAWKLENLKEGRYLLAAITDKNANNRYDPKSEKIGFFRHPIQIPNDTLYALEMFREQPSFAVTRAFQDSGNKLVLGYLGRSNDATVEVSHNGSILETVFTKLPKRDSLQVWLPTVNADSLHIRTRSAGYEKTQWVKYKKQENDSLTIAPNTAAPMNLRQPFSLLSSTPVVRADSSRISVTTKDSSSIAFSVNRDVKNRITTIDFEREPEMSYSIQLLPGALTDFYGQTNDTLSFRADTRSSSEYGNLRVLLENASSFPVMVELTDNKGEVKYSALTQTPAVDFRWITPATYTLRAIYDENENGIWDTGNYLEKRQPEPVIYFGNPIEIRANWDVEQPFTLP